MLSKSVHFQRSYLPNAWRPFWPVVYLDLQYRLFESITRRLYCAEWTQYSIRPKRSAICNRCFPGPTRVVDANGISIASVVQSLWNVPSCIQTGIGWSWQSWAGGASGVPTRVCRWPSTRSVSWRSTCSLLALNCQARLSSAMKAPGLSCIGPKTFQSAVTGWRVKQWQARTHEHTTWVTSTAGHRAVTTWTACRTTAFELPRWSLAQMRTALVWDDDGQQTCDGLMTAVHCCRDVVLNPFHFVNKELAERRD